MHFDVDLSTGRPGGACRLADRIEDVVHVVEQKLLLRRVVTLLVQTGPGFDSTRVDAMTRIATRTASQLKRLLVAESPFLELEFQSLSILLSY